MKALITGSTGFVGSHLVEELHGEGHSVYGLVRNERKWQDLKLPGQPIMGDLSQSSLMDWVQSLPEDLTHFVHTAGVVHSFDKEIFNKVNTEATINLVEALKKRFPTLHFVFISSLAAVGPSTKESAHDEKGPMNPPSLYGQSKKRAEEFLKETLPSSWTLTIIRPPMVIGPRDPAVLDVFKMVQSRIVLNTGLKGPQKLYSFVCVHDLVEVIKKAMEREDKEAKVYFSSHPDQHTFGEIISEMARQMSKKPIQLPVPFPVISTLAHTLSGLNKVFPLDARLTPDKLHELKPDAWTCSGLRSREELGVQYKWDLPKTVEITLKDYRDRGWL